MLEKLMPRSDEFFDDFDKQAQATVDGARLLTELLSDMAHVAERVQAIKDAEHRGDEVTHTAFNRLHTQFITPFDRGEIHRLLSRIDDVLDLTDAAADRIRQYEVADPPPEVKELGELLLQAAKQVQIAVKGLRDIKKPDGILAACREIAQLEKKADQANRGGIAKLFKSGVDALTVMKWKEIYELLEAAVDRADDVANVIEGVVLEHS